MLNARGEVEALIHRVEDVTKLSQARLEQETFFQVSIDMLCISSFDGHFKKVNPAFEATLGHTAEVAKQLDHKSSVLNFENRYRCKDGSYRLLSWKSAPVGDLMYACARDITENRKAEDDLKTTQASLELMNHDLRTFSYSIAHDLRAPLRSMVGFSNIVLEEDAQSLSPESRDCMHKISKSGQKMGKLIEGLLELSHLAQRQVVPKPVNLSAVAREIATELQTTCPDRSVRFEVEDRILGHGNVHLLRLLLMNLLGNAWKYTAKNQTPAVIKFGCREDDGRRVYFVRDNGAGFDMKHVGKMFGVFQRLHSSSEFEGIGIGLATADRIIQAHGGKIWAEGEVNAGANISFTLN